MKRFFLRVIYILSFLLLPLLCLYFIWDVLCGMYKGGKVAAAISWRTTIIWPLKVTINDIKDPTLD